MDAKQFLEASLGGNMNISTLKPIVFIEIMNDFNEHKKKELNLRTVTPITIKGEYGVPKEQHVPIDYVKNTIKEGIATEIMKHIQIKETDKGWKTKYSVEFKILPNEKNN